MNTMKSRFTALLDSVVEWLGLARRARYEEPVSPQQLRTALTEMLANPQVRRLVFQDLVGTVLPIQGGMACTQDKIPKFLNTACALTDSLFMTESSSGIGIGALSPSYRADIEGPAGTWQVLNVRNPSGAWGQYALIRAQTDIPKDARYVDFGYFRGTSEADRGFVIQSQSGARLVTVLESGNVGIGTPSPAEKLDVAGNIKSNGLNRIVFLRPLGGTQNDSAQINSAIAALPSQGGIVMLVPGPNNEPFRIDSTITNVQGGVTKQGVKIRGYGGGWFGYAFTGAQH